MISSYPQPMVARNPSADGSSRVNDGNADGDDLAVVVRLSVTEAEAFSHYLPGGLATEWSASEVRLHYVSNPPGESKSWVDVGGTLLCKLSGNEDGGPIAEDSGFGPDAPACVDGCELAAGVSWAAVAILLYRHWPRPPANSWSLVPPLVGLLLNSGVERERAVELAGIVLLANENLGHQESLEAIQALADTTPSSPAKYSRLAVAAVMGSDVTGMVADWVDEALFADAQWAARGSKRSWTPMET